MTDPQEVIQVPDQFGPQIMEMAQKLARWSETPDQLTCTYLSPAHRAAAKTLCEWMEAAGLQASIDAVGNVTGRLRSRNASAQTLLVASHYDTVVNAGRYDGRLGILSGIVVAAHLHRTGHELPFHLDIVGFSEEEGVRFSVPYIGSSAIAGHFDPGYLQQRDSDGTTLAELLRIDGTEGATIRALARPAGSLRGYIEVHIEQGPVLLERQLPVGIVTAIAGASRYRIVVEGVAGHAGTVPMALRHDAAAAAAEMVLAVERRCVGNGDLVGTVGQISVPQGLINVIPGRCEFSIDVRSGNDAIRDAAIADILEAVRQIARRRGVAVNMTEIANYAAVPCAPQIQSAFAEAVQAEGIEPYHLPSGAGHDAIMFSGLTDLGMLFVRCGNGGISHNPLEIITAADADVAARVLLRTILSLGRVG